MTANAATAGVGPRPASAPIPAVITVTTARGESKLPVTLDPISGPAISGEGLVRALSGGVLTDVPWVNVTLARQSFRFLLGAPVYSFNDRLQPLSGTPYRVRDSVFLPLQFVTEILPEVLSERFQWDPRTYILRDLAPPPQPEVAVATKPGPRQPGRLPNGLLPGHVVTVDAGHGGIDPGNPGVYFPRGVNEKHVTLQVALLLRDELKQRGIKVVMTRTTDTLINLLDRGRFCTDECDLFVSLHVDALPASARRKYGDIDGFHTIIIGEENTEDADRIARMENDALRYEGGDTAVQNSGGLDFILRNLQMNEYLRESARAAELVQSEVAKVHTGTNRGVKQSRVLAVLNTARRPAILVEMGFSTNPQDARLMTSRKSQMSLATSIADAIVEYLLEYERKTGGGSAGRGRGR